MTETEKKLNHLITAIIEVNTIESVDFEKLNLEALTAVGSMVVNLRKLSEKLELEYKKKLKKELKKHGLNEKGESITPEQK